MNTLYPISMNVYPSLVNLWSLFFGQIFGIKTLVKSYLPVKDAHLRGGIQSLIEILRNMLTFGDFSEELESRYG